MIKLAILSPSQNAHSETFIRAHKNLPFIVKFYHGGYVPEQLEPFGRLPQDLENTEQIAGLNMRESIFRSSLKREGIDCVMAEFGVTAAESLNSIKSLNLPLIANFYGFDASIKSVLEQYESKYKEVFDYASFVVVVSNKMADDLFTLGCPKEKIVVSYCGASSKFLKILPRYNKKQFVAVSRFVEKKSPHATIAAFRNVVTRHPDCKLIFVGEGPLYQICKLLVISYKLTSNVQFMGYQSPEQIREIFSESIAFVQHSVTAKNGDSEGTPVAILEAGAVGLPVISTRHAGIPDVILDGVTGILVDEFDIEGMTKSMLRILENPKLGVLMGKKSKDHVRKNFTLAKHLQCLKMLINNSVRISSDDRKSSNI